MLAVPEAQAIVLQQTQPLAPETARLGSALLGLVLAEDVTSDIDSPPFDKSMMDGYALRAADLLQGTAEFTIIEEVTAGQTPTRTVGAGQVTRIMTGAPIPSGADAVVMIERTEVTGPQAVRIEDDTIQPGKNILPRGREMRTGEVVLPAGTPIRPQELGLLAAVGRSTVRVFPAPRVAVLATGDELVEPSEKPGPGQIRNGNGPMLLGQTVRAGGIPHYLGIAQDQVDSLRPLIEEGLRCDVLLLSGGVSAGKLDLVPGVLQGMGVQAHFHKIAMKPGKPLFFGTRGSTLVFGLPGNPVSSFIGFELFVRPALRQLRGYQQALPSLPMLPLAEDFCYRTDRLTYYPVRLVWKTNHCQAQPVPWFGSPDLRALTGAEAFAVIPPGDHVLAAGTRVEVLLVEGAG